MGNLDFNEKWRSKTKLFAVEIVRFYSKMPKTDENRILGKQLLRSATSVAANFRAFSRGRSTAKRYAKLCIVVEEADESLFWLELIQETTDCQVQKHIELATEITKVMSTYRRKMNQSK